MGDRKLEYSIQTIIRDICIRQIRSFDIINKKNCISSAYTKDKLYKTDNYLKTKQVKVLHPCRQYHSVIASKRYPALPNFEENKVAEEFHIFQDRMALIQI
ncbi:hypothetical protein ALC53_11411 [Atta colombica]|uniref:Uncharacterized protein n=1 Tax=Atta colombica TaxID=520822 RepID=A0A195B179_9HYME|nr:hypothetical protein ALC53_11411 [Atta colombica]